MTINLLFIVYNIVAFLIPLKIKSWLLIVFYALASAMTISRIVELSYISNPDDDCVSITYSDSIGQTVAAFVATLVNIAICSLFLMTMY